MTRSIEKLHVPMMPHMPYGAGSPLVDADDRPASGLLVSVHRLLRGRYVWLVLLATVLAAGGAYAGYKTWEPLYQSVGQIRVAPRMPVILNRIEDQDISGMYDGYIETQTTLLSSTRIVEFAMQSQIWKDLKQNYEAESVIEFRNALRVSRAKGGQMISITYSDRDPQVARVAVQAIIEAYMAIYSEEDDKANQDRSRVLENLRTVRAAELKANRERLHELAKIYGSRSLATVFDNKQKLVQDLESKLFELQQARAQIQAEAKAQGIPLKLVDVEQKTEARAPAASDAPVAPEAAIAPEEVPASTARFEPRMLKPQEIAARDTTMANLLQSLEAMKAELVRLRDNRLETHPSVVEAVKEMNRLEQRIAAYTTKFIEVFGKSEEEQALELSRRVQIMIDSENRLRDTLKPLKAEVVEIGIRSLEIERYEDEIENAKVALNEVQGRIEELNVESYVTGRVSVINKGDHPGPPVNASVRMRQAILWGGGGAALAVGLFSLLGVMDRRMRFADDFQHVLHRTSLLGVIPEIPLRSRDPQIAAEAAMSVNQIRAMLQLGAVAAQHRVFAIVSGSPGEGKTSITLSLGTSFAKSGSRVLLIDFDLSGHNLSSRSGCVHRVRLGQMLKQLGFVTDNDVVKAMQWAREHDVRLGRALVDLGMVATSDIDHALQQQTGTSLGLIDALSGESLANCIIATHTPNLAVLPVGEGETHHMTAISPLQVRDLLDRARKEYDIVLVDTGPLPASLEGSVVTAHADDAIVVISKDSPRKSMQRLLDHLQVIGTNIAGLVFNRAARGCVDRYGSSSSRSRRVSRPLRKQHEDRDKTDFGLLAQATSISSNPAPSQGSPVRDRAFSPECAPRR